MNPLDSIVISEIMATNVFCVEDMVPAKEVIAVMAERDIGSVLVTRGEMLVGIFTERDLLHRFKEHFSQDFSSMCMKDVMTPSPLTIRSSDKLSLVEEIFQKFGYRHYPVVDDGKITGIVSLKDFTNAKLRNLNSHNAIKQTQLAEVDDLLHCKNNRKVLLVESSRSVRSFVSAILTEENFEVVEATTAAQALQFAADQHFVAMVNALELPDRSGFELVSELKKMRHHVTTPVVCITSKEGQKVKLNAFDSGVDEFIAKSDILYLLVPKLNIHIRRQVFGKLQASERRLEDFRSVVVTYNHQFNNISAALMGQLHKQQKGFVENGKEPDFDKLIEIANRFKKVINQMNSINEVREVAYTESINMIDLGDKSDQKH